MKRFDSFDGTTICFYEWGFAGDEPPVVLHHGFVADARANWADPAVVDALTGAGHWVIAVDARGHGASGKPHDPAYYGEPTMARDLSALFDALGLDEVYLVGYSMGAVVSLLATADDERISKLAIGGLGAGAVELGGLNTDHVSRAAIIEAMSTDDPGSIEQSGAAQLRKLADAVGADRDALIAHARAQHTGRLPLDGVTAPTLVLAGDDDPFAERPEVLTAALPDARTVLLRGDHLRAVSDPAFTTSIIEFLKE